MTEPTPKTPLTFTLSVDGRLLGTVKPATLDIEPFDELTDEPTKEDISPAFPRIPPRP